MKKQNSVLRLTSQIYSSPQLITKEAFSVIEQYLDARNEGILLYDEWDEEDEKKSSPFYDKKEKIGVLNISGTLSNKPIVTMCGEVGTSYSKLLEQSREMIDAGVKTIVMNVSSGGGQALNCFNAASEFRAMCDTNDVAVYGYNEDLAASAAYAWLSVCDEVYAHPDAETGSIGVLISLMDSSKAMDQMGLKRVFVTAGGEKIPYAEDGSFKKEFLEDLQYKVDVMYENFVSHISQHMGLSSEAVKATQAKTFLSKDAEALGLINGVKTEREFQDYVISKHKGNK